MKEEIANLKEEASQLSSTHASQGEQLSHLKSSSKKLEEQHSQLGNSNRLTTENNIYNQTMQTKLWEMIKSQQAMLEKVSEIAKSERILSDRSVISNATSNLIELFIVKYKGSSLISGLIRLLIFFNIYLFIYD